MNKEKLYEVGKKEFEKELGYIPTIDECEFYEIKDSTDELYCDCEVSEDGELISETTRIKTVEFIIGYCLEYETIIKESWNNKKEITMTIKYDENGDFYARYYEKRIYNYEDRWKIEK